MRRVVITGIGIWSCLGTNIEEVHNSLRSGKSGIGIDNERIKYGYRSGLTGKMVAGKHCVKNVAVLGMVKHGLHKNVLKNNTIY